MTTPIEELKSAVWWNKSLNFRNFWNRNPFYWDFSAYQVTDAREKNHDFLNQYWSTSAVSPIDFLKEEFELMVAEIWKFEKIRCPQQSECFLWRIWLKKS